MPSETSIRVECYAGHRGAESPRHFFVHGRRVEIVEIVDTWQEPDCHSFKVEGDDGRAYLLKHRPSEDDWLLAG